MLTVKKKVILLSCLGVIPFYSDILISLINNFYNVKLFQKINLVSYFYGALVSCFLCGMQWVKFIDIKKNLYIPMIPSILPTYNRAKLSFVKGEGSWLVEADGRRFLDLGSGIAKHIS